MRIRNQTGDRAQNAKWLNLQMRREAALNAALVDGNQAVILFVDVKVLNQPVAQKIFE